MAGEVKSNWVTDDVYAAADANDVANAINRSLGAAQAYVTTIQTTTSTSYTDLATTTDQVTVTIGPSGMALVSIYALMFHDTTGGLSETSFATSGTNTIAANDYYAFNIHAYTGGAQLRSGATFLLTGLNAGSTTFKMKYRIGSGSGTGSWGDRRIAVVPL